MGLAPFKSPGSNKSINYTIGQHRLLNFCRVLKLNISSDSHTYSIYLTTGKLIGMSRLMLFGVNFDDKRNH